MKNLDNDSNNIAAIGNQPLHAQFSRSQTTVSWQKNILCHLNGCGCSSSPFIWISEKLKCVYFEIPKTGSSSIKSILNMAECGFFLFWGSPHDAVRRFQGYYKFTVIRDPIQRMLSNFKMFCLSDIKFRHLQIEALFEKAHDQISVDDFIELGKRYHNHHWEKMVRYLPIGPGMEAFMLDKVILLEALAADWQDVQRALGIQCELPRNNSTAHIKLKVELEDKTRRNLEEQYAEDVLLYNRYKAGK